MAFHRDRRATPLCAKIRPPRSGRPEKAGGLRRRCLRVAQLRDCAPLLATGLLRAITTVTSKEFTPSAGEYVAKFKYNSEVIFWTEGYSSKSGAQNAIESIQKNGPAAPTED